MDSIQTSPGVAREPHCGGNAPAPVPAQTAATAHSPWGIKINLDVTTKTEVAIEGEPLLVSSALQQIHRHRHIMHAEILCQCRILPHHGLIHRMGYVAVGNVSCRGGPLLGNVNRLGEIHIDEGTL